MGKRKRKAAEAPSAGELIHARVLREQRWAYERRRERLSWGQIADLAPLPPERGGLGYPRSARALKAAYAEHVAEVVRLEEATRPEATTIALAAMDESYRELTRLAQPVDEVRTELARRAAEANGATADELARIVVLRDEAAIRDAIKARHVIERDRAKLLGLDAPIVVDVTTHDATVDDLNAALARLGEAPYPTREKTTHAQARPE